MKAMAAESMDEAKFAFVIERDHLLQAICYLHTQDVQGRPKRLYTEPYVAPFTQNSCLVRGTYKGYTEGVFMTGAQLPSRKRARAWCCRLAHRLDPKKWPDWLSDSIEDIEVLL